jgi:hypothetical protein
MVKVIEERGFKVLSTDITDYGFGRSGIDFLATTKCPADVVITNPPFDISPAFIQHCIDLKVPKFAMLLKSQYWHVADRIKLFEACPPAIVYALTWRLDFYEDEKKLRRDQGEDVKAGGSSMECLWCCWIEGEHDTKYRLMKRGVK